MNLSDNSSPAPEQILLDALIELRRLIESRHLDAAGVFGNSGHFRAYMLDLSPKLKREVRVLSGLIDAGFLARLQEADEKERVIIAGQIRRWLDEELQLKPENRAMRELPLWRRIRRMLRKNRHRN